MSKIEEYIEAFKSPHKSTHEKLDKIISALEEIKTRISFLEERLQKSEQSKK